MTKHSKWMRSCTAALLLSGAAACGSSGNGEAQPSGSTGGQSSLPATTGAGAPAAGGAGKTSTGTSATTAAGSSAAPGASAGKAGTPATATGGTPAASSAAGASAAGATGAATGTAGSAAGSSAAVGGGAGSTGAAGGGGAATGGPLKYTGAFTMGTMIPAKNKCPMVQAFLGGGMGENKSPALSWSGGPAETKSYAIVLYDTGFSMLHWVMWDIPATVHELPEGLATGYELQNPMGAHQVAAMMMSQELHRYYGPCSSGASGSTYEFRLYALKEAKLTLTESSTGAQAQMAVEAAKLEMVAWSGKPE